MEAPIDRLWDDYYAMAVDQYPSVPAARRKICDALNQEPAHKVFDLIELLLEISNWPKAIIERINFIFEREGSVHRVVGGEIVDRMDSEEISEVEAALALPEESIKRHIRQALRLLKGEAPNYGASMAQSITAAETAVDVILGEHRTLGDGLSELERRGFPMHGAFKSALAMLYGFTSDADGIRHGKTGEGLAANGPNARFLLVACSAFVNFLLSASDQPAPLHE